MVQFPNSKFAPDMEQRLREIQEVLAEHEYRVGDFYHRKGSYPASTNRLDTLVDHYPLYSRADEALWRTGDAYGRMGPRFRAQSVEAFQRIVREYPLSALAEDARKKLQEMEAEVPEADPVALARMEYERENQDDAGRFAAFWGIFRSHPSLTVRAAAKSGTPAGGPLRPSIPQNIPGQAGSASEVSADVTVSTVGDSSALDTKPDARSVPPRTAPPQQPPPQPQQQ
jgi:outer membrane protein assembly factor BamD